MLKGTHALYRGIEARTLYTARCASRYNSFSKVAFILTTEVFIYTYSLLPTCGRRVATSVSSRSASTALSISAFLCKCDMMLTH